MKTEVQKPQKPRLRWQLAQNLVRLLWWFDVLEAYTEAVGRSRAGMPPLVWEYAGEVLQGLPERPAAVDHALSFVERLARWKLGRARWPQGWA